MKWIDRIPACFGTADSVFAGHHSEESQAIDLLRQCYAEGVTLDELLKEVEKYLLHKHPVPADKQLFNEHIATQLKRVHERFSPWLA